jgi:hypothetical protein
MGSGKAGMLVPERSRWQAQVDGRDELPLIRVSALSKQTDEQELVPTEITSASKGLP